MGKHLHQINFFVHHNYLTFWSINQVFLAVLSIHTTTSRRAREVSTKKLGNGVCVRGVRN